MAEQQQRGDQLTTIGARLDQLVALVQTRLVDRLDQLAGALARVQTQLTELTELTERLAQLRADLVEEPTIWPDEPVDVDASDDVADSTVGPEAP